ncbi:hypothetical protein PR202_ga10702 [Eleusine coracana subsp. coracana]|uniref:Uncharacterized protein n=1 Tax=Eleusine coracana subsp. coracana TaxID=191504 RepID=A0AAV5C7A6_ELECO|nr:hypothetical protein PR202_ga10702 [Eleusine coracana subsp. coracana]
MRLDRMEGLEGGDGGLRFFLQFDPGKLDRALFGASLSALFSRFLGWTKSAERRGSSMADGQESAAAAAVVSAAALTAAVSVCLAAMHASGRRPRLARRPRRSAAETAGTSSSAARPRPLPASHDGLRILSSKVSKDSSFDDHASFFTIVIVRLNSFNSVSKDESLENVIHGASIGAGDDEPVIVARVMETTDADTAGANAEKEHGQSEAEHRQDAERLRELWLSLVEREQRLELRLQELEGLREQEATARELENRVAAAAMEARLMELKVSSLQEENGRLRAQLDDARAQLARAKEKLRAIKARVQDEQEEARREAAALRARVAELETGGEERAAAVEAEAVALREANAALEEENMELALRLQEAEQAASSVHLALEIDAISAVKCIETVDSSASAAGDELEPDASDRGAAHDHCAHVEELVYLKWVNACLRHELSDHGLHPPCSANDDDGVSAMALSKSMSFRSSERAKQLMLRYGHPPGLDPAFFSPLHESVDGDDHQTRERSPAGTPSVMTATTPAASTVDAAQGKKTGVGQRKKLKFLGNFKKLLPGAGKRSRSSSHGGARDENESGRQIMAPSPSDEYLEKAMQWLSTHDVLDFDHSYETTPLSSCDRTPPSSVTTATTRGGAAAAREEEEPTATLARSKSDGGKSYGREATRYHSLRPDHPADEAKKWERRRRSEELTSPGAARG